MIPALRRRWPVGEGGHQANRGIHARRPRAQQHHDGDSPAAIRIAIKTGANWTYLLRRSERFLPRNSRWNGRGGLRPGSEFILERATPSTPEGSKERSWFTEKARAPPVHTSEHFSCYRARQSMGGPGFFVLQVQPLRAWLRKMAALSGMVVAMRIASLRCALRCALRLRLRARVVDHARDALRRARTACTLGRNWIMRRPVAACTLGDRPGRVSRIRPAAHRCRSPLFVLRQG